MNKTTMYAGTVLALIFLALAGTFAYRAYDVDTPSSNTDTTTDAASGDNKITLEGVPEGATVTVTDRLDADLFAKTPKPSLERTLPQGSFSGEQHALLKTKRQEVVDAITENPAATANWINLGILHKQADDYEGAKIYWTYVTTVNPGNLTAHWNLASLYELYLKDLVQAEKEFMTVIALDKTYISAYSELAIVYIAQGKNDKALAILSSGVAVNPGALDLFVARAHLYRSMGKNTEARSDYNTAISLAKTAKDTNSVNTLTAERDAL